MKNDKLFSALSWIFAALIVLVTFVATYFLIYLLGVGIFVIADKAPTVGWKFVSFCLALGVFGIMCVSYSYDNF